MCPSSPAARSRAAGLGRRGRAAGAGAGSGAGAGRPLCGRRREGGDGGLGAGSGPAVKRQGEIYDPVCKGAEGLSPPVGPGSGCPDSRIVPSAPLRASPRRRPPSAVSLPPPRGSAALRARPLPPAPWEAKVTACARSGSRPLPSWKSGSSVPYLSSV